MSSDQQVSFELMPPKRPVQLDWNDGDIDSQKKQSLAGMDGALRLLKCRIDYAMGQVRDLDASHALFRQEFERNAAAAQKVADKLVQTEPHDSEKKDEDMPPATEVMVTVPAAAGQTAEQAQAVHAAQKGQRGEPPLVAFASAAVKPKPLVPVPRLKPLVPVPVPRRKPVVVLPPGKAKHIMPPEKAQPRPRLQPKPKPKSKPAPEQVKVEKVQLQPKPKGKAAPGQVSVQKVRRLQLHPKTKKGNAGKQVKVQMRKIPVAFRGHKVVKADPFVQEKEDPVVAADASAAVGVKPEPKPKHVQNLVKPVKHEQNQDKHIVSEKVQAWAKAVEDFMDSSYFDLVSDLPIEKVELSDETDNEEPIVQEAAAAVVVQNGQMKEEGAGKFKGSDADSDVFEEVEITEFDTDDDDSWGLWKPAT